MGGPVPGRSTGRGVGAGVMFMDNELVRVVRLAGDLDAGADEAYAVLAAVCGSGARVVIEDMTGTKFCDSLGARVLLRAHRLAIPESNGTRATRSWNLLQTDAISGTLPIAVETRDLMHWTGRLTHTDPDRTPNSAADPPDRHSRRARTRSPTVTLAGKLANSRSRCPGCSIT